MAGVLLHFKNCFGTHLTLRRNVVTWSHLASAFNSDVQKKYNCKDLSENVGLFKIKELHSASGFRALQEKVKSDVNLLVNEATSSNRERKLVQVFDQLSDCLCRLADMADFVRVAHPDAKYSRAAEDVCVSIGTLVEKLNTNSKLYDSLNNVIHNGDVVPTSNIDKRIAELFLFDFEQSGINLSQKTREQFVKINENILQIGSIFGQNSQQAVTMQYKKLPDHLKRIFPSSGDNVVVNGLYSDHHSELVREAAYRLYLYPNQNQQQLLETLLNLRFDLAQLVGFPSYAHRAIRGTFGDTPERVMNFLELLAEKIRIYAEKDFSSMQKMKSGMGSHQNLQAWDVAYFAGVARHEQCQISNAEVMPYLSLGCCMHGLSLLLQQIYGINLKLEEAELGELWSSDVHKLAVIQENEGILGYIYCDFFERPGKPSQDCHFTIQGGRELENGTYQKPVVVLMLNLPPSRGHVPSLLTPPMMENLFHEFGHAMHSMLGRTQYQHVTGTRCPTDFAEVPSVLMEYFASDARVLGKFARHWQTGEPLSSEKINKIIRAKHIFAASEIQTQICYSIVDQLFHGKNVHDMNLNDVVASVQNKYYGLKHIPNTAWHLRFSHFVGYGAKYYSYLMSKAIAARIWNLLFKDDPFSRASGNKLRYDMLAFGGSKHPSELISMVLGDVTIPSLVDTIMDDLKKSAEQME